MRLPIDRVLKFRPAGEKLINFMQSGIGEEVLEGVIGGGLVGIGLLHTDQPIEQTALQTGLAMAGGVGLGMGARRIGANMGRHFYPQALKDQQGPIAGLARMSGQDGLITGAKDSLANLSQSLRQQTRELTVSRIKSEFNKNPAEVARAFNMTEKQFKEVIPLLEQADDVVGQRASGMMDEFADDLRNAAGQSAGRGNDAGDLAADLQTFVADSMQAQPTQITGEHVGRMIGRGIGDEVGIMGGVALGAGIGQSLGWESEKDRQIRELQAQLGNQ